VEGPFCCTISLYVFSELKSDSYSYRIHSPSTSKLQHYVSAEPSPISSEFEIKSPKTLRQRLAHRLRKRILRVASLMASPQTATIYKDYATPRRL
jgi:hypothetical protein